MQAVPIFVISLARARLRRERIREHLDSLGLVYEVIDAVDGRQLAAESLTTVDASGGVWEPGTVGCYLSHLNVYQIIIERNLPVALILEDDARLNRQIVQLLKSGFEFTQFDYLFLDCETYNSDGPVFYDISRPSDLGFGFTSFPLSAGPEAAHALLITLEAVKRRLGCALPMRKPIDVYSHLPEHFRFAAILRPRGAYLAEDSLVSFTSARDSRLARPRFGRLRRFPAFLALKNLVGLRYWRPMCMARRLMQEGRLAPEAKWRVLPAGRSILEVNFVPLDDK